MLADVPCVRSLSCWQVVPFASIEWASCTGNDALCVLVKAADKKPTGLIFATAEQRDLVIARLSEWNVQQAPNNMAQQGWSSGSSDNAPASGLPYGMSYERDEFNGFHHNGMSPPPARRNQDIGNNACC